ncbi:hypothetical protein [Citrobacter freundii]|uniref:hypothetical protein n=1 Tax=Citrobacter freundii TaxID=546 RepID=UPI00200F6AE3|nr:hypothetical protein [Citrobacter freundii]UQI38073.1 hypothetical protein M3L74_10030 [Citrobacter freundii]
MNTIEKSSENSNIIIGEVKPLDVETLLNLYGAATSARQKDGSVLIDADTLQQMAKELILAKSAPVIRSDTREMQTPSLDTQAPCMKGFTVPEWMRGSTSNMDCGAS